MGLFAVLGVHVNLYSICLGRKWKLRKCLHYQVSHIARYSNLYIYLDFKYNDTNSLHWQ